MNAATCQGIGQGRHGFGVRLEVIEKLQSDANLVGGRPFQQLGPVDAILAADLVSGQASLLDPAQHRALVHVQKLHEIANTKLHDTLSGPDFSIYPGTH